jgi:hypothetical protein
MPRDTVTDTAAARVVNVDRRNFDVVQPVILDCISRAAFIGVDAELSGIGKASERNAKVRREVVTRGPELYM